MAVSLDEVDLRLIRELEEALAISEVGLAGLREALRIVAEKCGCKPVQTREGYRIVPR